MSITETARQRIKDDLLMENNYSTPDEILDYLRDENNFRSLSSLLKDTMIEAKACNMSADDSEFVKVLTDLLVELEKECGNEIKRDDKRKSVSRWFSGEVSGISDFETAIKICFALGLDLKQTNIFLNKCGFCSLSIRKAEDSVYYYYLLQNNSETKKCFADAQKLINRYKNTAITEEVNNSNQDKEKKSTSSTTITMIDKLKDTNWDTDDTFLSSFLIPYTKNFINYSKSALLEYYKAKNMLFVTAMLYKVRNEEQPIIKDYYALKSQGEPKVLTEEDGELHIQFALRSSLEKYQEPKNNAEIIETYKKECKFSELERSFLDKRENDPVAERLCEIYRNIHYKNLGYENIYLKEDNKVYDRINIETYQSLLALKKCIFATDSIESHIIISHVLSDICSPMDIYKSALGVLIKPGANEDDLISLGKDGVISGTLLTRKVFSRFESDPSIKTKKQSIDINHKMIIMMYYLLFSLEKYKKDFGDDDKDSKDNLAVFPDCTFISFIDIVNGTLEKCSLPILYLPNQFDCAIVMSIRKFETANNSNEYLNTPFDFFNELLRLILIDSNIETTNVPYWEKELWDEDKE